jgi:hypothetical protein
MNVKQLKKIISILPDDMKIMLDTNDYGYYKYLTRTSKLITYNPKCTSNVTSLYEKVLLLIPENVQEKKNDI